MSPRAHRERRWPLAARTSLVAALTFTASLVLAHAFAAWRSAGMAWLLDLPPLC